MRKHPFLRSVLAIALVLCMTLGIAVPALAAEKDVIKYVSLGASNVNGLRMEGYYPANGGNVYGYKQHCIKAYPYLFSKALEKETGKTVELTQLAISSFRAEEVHVLVDDNYRGDSYTEWRFLHTGTPEDGDEWFDHVATFDGIQSENNGIAEDDTALNHLRKVYQNALTEADVITIDVGMNNFGVYLFKRIVEGMMGQPTLDADLSIYDAPNLDFLKGLIRAVIGLPTDSGEDQDMVDLLIDTVLYAYLGLINNFDDTLDHIYAMNPDAEIVVVGLYNTAKGINVIMGDTEIPLGDVFGLVLDLANSHLESKSVHADRTAYVNSDGRHNFYEQLTVENPSYDKLSYECKKVMYDYTKELTGLEDPDQILYATDVMTKIFGKAMDNYTLDLSAVANMDFTGFMTDTLTCVFTALETGEIDLSFLDEEPNKSAGLFFCRFICLDWFFIHPDEQGHSDAANQIMAVYKDFYLGNEPEVPTEPEEPSEPVEPEQETEVIRISGSNRTATAREIADELKLVNGIEEFETIIYANGDIFADALTGTYLANTEDAPILLYRPGETAKNLEYIKANLAKDGVVYILGGTAAMPESVEEELIAAGIEVERLTGKTRFETNLKILAETGFDGGDTILVVTGWNSADCLAASALGMPILMVDNGAGKLLDSQVKYLESLAAKNDFVIIGGEAAVGEKLAKELAAYDADGTVERLKGKNRFETSTVLAENFFDTDKMVLAYGWEFADALCGGPLAYSLNAPIILADADKAEFIAEYTNEAGIASGYVLGGTARLNDATVRTAFNMAKDDVITVK